MAAASSTALAADLEVAAYVPQVYNWNGFYVGANVGAAWARGILTDNASVASVTRNNSGVSAGGTFGYNWQFAPNWVLGIEGTFDGTSIGKTATEIDGTFFGACLRFDPRQREYELDIDGRRAHRRCAI